MVIVESGMEETLEQILTDLTGPKFVYTVGLGDDSQPKVYQRQNNEDPVYVRFNAQTALSRLAALEPADAFQKAQVAAVRAFVEAEFRKSFGCY